MALLGIKLGFQVLVFDVKLLDLDTEILVIGLSLLADYNVLGGFHRGNALVVIGAYVSSSCAVGVNTSEMFVQVLQSRETFAVVALAVRVWTVQGVLRAAVFAVDFTLVSQKTPRVRKPWQLLASLNSAFVRAIVFVHVLAVIQVSITATAEPTYIRQNLPPFALAPELLHIFGAFREIADVFAVRVLDSLPVGFRDRFGSRSRRIGRLGGITFRRRQNRLRRSGRQRPKMMVRRAVGQQGQSRDRVVFERRVYAVIARGIRDVGIRAAEAEVAGLVAYNTHVESVVLQSLVVGSVGTEDLHKLEPGLLAVAQLYVELVKPMRFGRAVQDRVGRVPDSLRTQGFL